MMILLFALLQTPAEAGCHPIPDDRILGRHIATIVPELSGLPPDQLIGYAPTPGVKRVFSSEQLQRLARKHGLNTRAIEGACFEWQVRLPEKKEFLAAMTRSLDTPLTRIEVLETSHQPTPPGEIFFPKSGLLPAPSTDLKGRFWRGYVVYSNRRRFPVWARVRITTSAPRVIALEKLVVGAPISVDQVRVVTEDTPALDHLAARTVEEVAGKIPRRSVPPGVTILRTQIQEPAEISKGQVVRVEADRGAVHFSLDARAESTGRRGETVIVRNPSGKTFRARVEGPGKASVGGTVQ